MTTNNNTTTETTLNLCDTDITIRQVSPGKPVMLWGAMRYRHTVTIKANDVSKRFSFHGSVNDYQHNKDRLTEDDLKDVLECVISDGIAGTYSKDEFYAEFGYDDESIRGQEMNGAQVYKACAKTLSMLNEMGLTEDMLYDISNAIHELDEVD